MYVYELASHTSSKNISSYLYKLLNAPHVSEHSEQKHDYIFQVSQWIPEIT